jgi:hypothetical protein
VLEALLARLVTFLISGQDNDVPREQSECGLSSDLDCANSYECLAIPTAHVRVSMVLSNLAALLRHQLFVYRDLFAWLNAPFEGLSAAYRHRSVVVLRNYNAL